GDDVLDRRVEEIHGDATGIVTAWVDRAAVTRLTRCLLTVAPGRLLATGPVARRLADRERIVVPSCPRLGRGLDLGSLRRPLGVRSGVLSCRLLRARNRILPCGFSLGGPD